MFSPSETETLCHSESQPEKPGKGFLTSDYNKRGEFTDTIRTEQYRSQLKVCLVSWSHPPTGRVMKMSSKHLSSYLTCDLSSVGGHEDTGHL